MCPIFSNVSAAKLPTFPNPWIAIVQTVGKDKFSRKASHAKNPPNPVAAVRPSLPPDSIGLPVKVALVLSPVIFAYSSAIQLIISGVVFTSGAGTSFLGPIQSASLFTQPRERLSNSVFDKSLGSTVIPPLPPPIGIFAIAHLIVIQKAKAFTSSIFVSIWYLIPPL